MFNIEKITDKEKLIRLKSKWNAILSNSHSDCIFLTWEWIYNWWQVYGKDCKLYVLVLKNAKEEIVGIAPLYVRRVKILKIFSHNEIRFLGSGGDVSPDYLDFIAIKGFEEVVAKNIMSYISNDNTWNLLYLTDILNSSHITKKFYSSVICNGFSIRQADKASCPYINLPESWDELLSRLSKNSRYNIRRRIRNLEKKFNVNFFSCQKQKDIAPLMEKLAFLHRNRWKDKDNRHAFSSKEYISFHNKVSNDFFSKGWLQLSCLQIDGDIVAIFYEYFYKNRIFYYQGGFDTSYFKFSVGLVLRSYIIQKAIKDGFKEIDLLKGGYKHKFNWTNLSRQTFNLEVFNKNFKSKILYFFYSNKSQVKSCIKKRLPGKILSILNKIHSK